MRDARIELTFADGDYSFRMGWGELAELQEKCDAGPHVVYSRLGDGSWKIEDISHTIRLGLIGGGLTPVDALKVVRKYVEARPPLESLLTAQAVLLAALYGVEEEQVGESVAPSPDQA